MKASTRLQKACELQDRVNELLDSVSDELNAIAGDNELRVFFQGGDGLCINDSHGNNAKVSVNEVDTLLSMSREELFKNLEAKGI